MSILEVVVIVFLIGCALLGYKRGLIVSVCSLFAFFIVLALTQAITPSIGKSLQNNEKVVEYISEHVDEVLFGDDDEEIKGEQKTIDELSIPKNLKKGLKENNNEAEYKELGADSFRGYVCIYISYSLINLLAYIIVFIVLSIVVRALIGFLNIMSKLPIIHTINKFGGVIFGLAEGVLGVWIAFIVIALFNSTAYGMQLYEQIEASNWLSYLFEKNIIYNALVALM